MNMEIIYKIKMALILIKILKNNVTISYSQILHKIVKQTKNFVMGMSLERNITKQNRIF